MADLERRTLTECLAEKLREEIAGGVWTGRMPGYRVLCAKYEVSRPTCEAAFLILEKEGILAPAEPRRTRKITLQPTAAKPVDRRHLLAIVDRMHFHGPDYQQSAYRATNCW